jgi:hypothetical protein
VNLGVFRSRLSLTALQLSRDTRDEDLKAAWKLRETPMSKSCSLEKVQHHRKEWLL